MEKNICITDFDLKRFKWLLNNSQKFDASYKNNLEILGRELETALILEQEKIPADVITMNSKFRIKDLDTNKNFTYTLVFPFDADISQNKLSVLDSIGIRTIGCRVGDIIELDNSSTIKRIQIEEIIYQPESKGNYYV